jgi:hypothetical protein
MRSVEKLGDDTNLGEAEILIERRASLRDVVCGNGMYDTTRKVSVTYMD